MTLLPTPLDSIDVASPCTAAWDAMEGNDRVRFCTGCRQQVFNLSGMTRPEAEQVISDHAGQVCVRFYRRHDGTLLTRDCPQGLRAPRRRVARRLAGIAAMIGTILFGRPANPLPSSAAEPAPLAALSPRTDNSRMLFNVPPKDREPPVPPPIMGKVSPPTRIPSALRQ